MMNSDGSIWFTDPPFGLLGNYEGRRNEQELPQSVYRIDGETGEASVVRDRLPRPERACLLARRDQALSRRIARDAEPPDPRPTTLSTGRTLANRPVFIDAGPGTPDGFRCDVDGNLWCGWGMGSDELDGVVVYNPQGKLIGRIRLPERCANVCFGGPMRNRLFMAAGQSLYSLYVNTQGALGG